MMRKIYDYRDYRPLFQQKLLQFEHALRKAETLRRQSGRKKAATGHQRFIPTRKGPDPAKKKAFDELLFYFDQYAQTRGAIITVQDGPW